MLNEAETRANHIDPALTAAGWGTIAESYIRREYVITTGRIESNGRRGASLKADYVLVYRNTKLAVIEAKAWDLPLTEGVQQAKDYAHKLSIRFAFATNGQGVHQIDMETGAEGQVAAFPTPDELWAATFAEANAWRDRFAAVSQFLKSGWDTRYYQDTAVARVLDAMAVGKTRVLLTLATGTGKTAIAFQIAWKLFHARWNIGGEPTRRPRILFLADRTILADQAFNAFEPFGEDACVRVKPEDIRKKGRVPKNASVFFTIFQTFMSGRDEAGNPAPYYGEYPPDFFDFIIIDECHRGGAQDESTWRGILDYFAPATQLGLTATPKRKDNVDTYAYFGEPVFVYSLKDGINDGYLTPFRVRRIQTTLDDYVWTPDDDVEEGQPETNKRYVEADFNRRIQIREREAKRVALFLAEHRPNEKSIIFCANQDHAALVRDLVNEQKTSREPNFCVRVTARDAKMGEQFLREFQDNEKSVPTVLTTSHKLSTGVDARNVRNIVLMRPVNSMIEFKQIIGRGTRLYDGKDYFTVFDFVDASRNFYDPEWDGEPAEPSPPTPKPQPGDEAEPGEPKTRDPTEREPRPPMIKIRLADGKERQIQSMASTTFIGADGRPRSSAQFLEDLFGVLPTLFNDEAALRSLWSQPDTRKNLLAALASKGFDRDVMAEMQKLIAAEDSDLFDVLAYVAFALAPVRREERATAAKAAVTAEGIGPNQQAFIDFVLGHYVAQGVDELDDVKLTPLLKLHYGGVNDALQRLGDAKTIRGLFVGFQRHLYERARLAA